MNGKPSSVTFGNSGGILIDTPADDNEPEGWSNGVKVIRIAD
jgi:hypothetical protein